MKPSTLNLFVEFVNDAPREWERISQDVGDKLISDVSTKGDKWFITYHLDIAPHNSAQVITVDMAEHTIQWDKYSVDKWEGNKYVAYDSNTGDVIPENDTCLYR